MRTTADGVLTLEGDLITVGRPHQAGLPAAFALLFGVTPVLATLAAVSLPLLSPEGVWVLVWLATSALLVLGPGLVGLGLLLLSSRAGRRGVVRLDTARRLIELPGQPPEVLRRARVVAVRWRGAGWCLRLDHRVLVRAPLFSGRSLAKAATRLATALECELDVPPLARRARVPLPRSPGVVAAMAYLPFEPLSVPLCLWILATSTHRRARFAATQSLALVLLEALFTTIGLALLAVPLILLGARVSPPVALALFAIPLVMMGLLRTVVRGLLSLRASQGTVTVVWGLGWLLDRRAPHARVSSAARLTPRREPERPEPKRGRVRSPRASRAPSVYPARAGGLGPWWT